MECIICGKEMQGRADKKYCSGKCKYEAFKFRYSHTCVICGKEYQSSHKSSRHCSSKCFGISERTRYKTTCHWCNKEIWVIPSERKIFKRAFCGNECVHAWKKNTGGGITGALRKNGRTIDKNGYVMVWAGRCKQELEHRKIMSEHLGRKLRSDEIVHHIDGNKSNNDISNLVIMTRAEHAKLHADLRNSKKKNG